MKLVIWQTDWYPTTPGVYLGCFPARHHDVTWVMPTTGERHEIVEWREGGVRRIEVRRRRDADLPKIPAAFVNRWNKLLGLVVKARLMDRLARERPDAIHVRDRVTEGLLGLWAARRHRVRFAYQLDNLHFEQRLHTLDVLRRGVPLERAWIRLWIRLRDLVLRGADVVFPVSAEMREWLRAGHGVDARRMVPFPVGVSLDTFERGGTTEVDPRVVDLAGQPTVCYLGGEYLLRDPLRMFATFREVALRLPESRFVVIGDWSDRTRAAAEEGPLAGRLRFVPPVPREEVPALLHAARVGVFLLPVEDDPYAQFRTCSPLKVAEYLSAGLPVVSSIVPDALEVIGRSGGGVCVESRPDAEAEAIVGYLRDPVRARADGSRGRAWVGENRRFDRLADTLEEAYGRLLATGWPVPDGSVGAGGVQRRAGWRAPLVRVATLARRYAALGRRDPRLSAQHFLLGLAYARGWRRVPVLPLYLAVEPNNSCNYHCPHCQVSHWSKPRIDLDVPHLVRILDQFPRVIDVILQGMGEPFLNKATPAMLGVLRERGIEGIVTTNGSVMTPGVREDLVRSRTHVVFSIDGATKEVFESVRVGSSFDRVVTNVRALVAARQDRAQRLEARMVVSRANVHELPAVVDLVADLGLDLLVAHMSLTAWAKPEMDRINRDMRVNGDPRLPAAVASATAAARRRGLELQVTRTLFSREDRCRWPWSRPYISSAGDVIPCCMIADAATMSLGNVFEHDFRDIWNSAAYQDLRGRLAADDPPPTCRGCYEDSASLAIPG